ncbi:helix-turn-helix domain-containing protein [Leifsonia aquatica]|uniref:AraC-like ligand-binding domain-containing protein n=1 Tax=Leifsonia aquatica TaxID=144185 RepID=UPI000468CEDC|nr:helix-turn-helix domain-containing protein [Leifsonia aquatica]
MLSRSLPHTPGGRVSTSVARTFDEFRTAVSESFVPLQVTSARPDPFWGRIRSAEADEVHVSEVSAAEHVVERTPELIARGDRQYFKLSLQLAGTGLLIQDDREAVLHPGDLAVYDTQRPYTLVFDDDFRTMVVMFPKRLIDLPADVVAQLTAVRMSGTSGVGGIIVPFLAQLVGNLEQLSGATGARLAHSALDLVTTMFANELDVNAGPGTPHQVLLQRIRAYIDRNLASTDLGPAQIAAAHFISTRHLHGIFREQGTTVSAWIRTRRLERCRRDLLSPLYADRPVAAIAARWGFVDAAHFSRVFKAAYAESPSELRAAARA